MGEGSVTYKGTRRLDPLPVQRFFRKVGFNFWFTRADTAWYLEHSLFVATAWRKGDCVGIAVLTGDGRIGVEIDLVAVDPAFRGKGIGSSLMRSVMARVSRLRPYHVKIEVFQRRTERFYSQFGFVRNRGTWLLEHEPTADRLRRRPRPKAQ